MILDLYFLICEGGQGRGTPTHPSPEKVNLEKSSLIRVKFRIVYSFWSPTNNTISIFIILSWRSYCHGSVCACVSVYVSVNFYTLLNILESPLRIFLKLCTIMRDNKSTKMAQMKLTTKCPFWTNGQIWSRFWAQNCTTLYLGICFKDFFETLYHNEG